VPQGRLIAEAFDFAPYRCIMDVAGDRRSVDRDWSDARASLGIVMDMEPVCVVAREQMAAKGLSDRFTRSPPT
jgi:hypothetical protein